MCEKKVKIYKYFSFDGLKKTLENSTLRFSNPKLFNDPFDTKNKIKFVATTDELYDFVKSRDSRADVTYIEANKKIILDSAKRVFNNSFDELYRKLGVACFTTNNNNLLMWAHYAEQHKGGVIEFDDTTDCLANHIIPIKYSKDMPSMNIKDLNDEDEASKKALTHTIYTKGDDWRYENELRVDIKSLTNSSYKDCPYDKTNIISVYVGCQMSADNIKEIVALVKKYPCAKIYQSVLKEDAYNLSFTEIQ
jgi:hypothetical protein